MGVKGAGTEYVFIGVRKRKLVHKGRTVHERKTNKIKSKSKDTT